MKKLKLVNLGKGLNRNEMKLVVGGDPGAPGTCQGVWVDCLCMGPTGPTICRVCSTSGSGQC
jgi:hypothetical protein